MTTDEQIKSAKNEIKLLEAMIRQDNSSYYDKGSYGRRIIELNKEVKKLKAQKQKSSRTDENVS